MVSGVLGFRDGLFMLIPVPMHLKLPFRSQFINYIEKNGLRNYYTYIMINAYDEGICVESERKKQHNIGLSTLK